MEDEEQGVVEVQCLSSPPVYLGVPEQREATTTAGAASRKSIKLALSMEEATSISRTSGCQVVDVTLRTSPSSVRYLVFKNRYTHCITVKSLSSSSPSEPSRWNVCVRDYVLMPNCHCEQGSQSWVVLGEEEGVRDMEEVSKLRLILRQPSPHWREFGVDHFTCYTVATCPLSSASLTRPHPASSTEQVSEKLGKLLCLAEESCDCVMTSSNSPFDTPTQTHTYPYSK